MNYKKINKNILILEQKYTKINKRFWELNILKSKEYQYLQEDKNELKKIWLEYIIIFDNLKNLLRFSRYRKYIFFLDYNKIVLNKYLIHLYFKILSDLIIHFWKHEDFIRLFLEENFKKDYWYYAKYIYKIRFINIFNVPKIFLQVLKSKMDSKIFEKIKEIPEIKYNIKTQTDYLNIFYYVKNRFYKIIYVLSKNIWYLISHTKFSNREVWFITKENIDKYLEKARPWDIFLSRENWWASNISIPWFWKHMSMYIWTWDFLLKNFDLKSQNINKAAYYIIEATWKWVNIVDIYNFVHKNDYLWVYRTVFTNNKIKRVIEKSLKNLWKWYDFIFNYYSEKRLVCSSLILKSYAKENEDDEWIDIELEQIWLALTYPPNNFALKANYDKNIEAIFFIDSEEKTQTNFIWTRDDLLKSYKRPKYSIFLK